MVFGSPLSPMFDGERWEICFRSKSPKLTNFMFSENDPLPTHEGLLTCALTASAPWGTIVTCGYKRTFIFGLSYQRTYIQLSASVFIIVMHVSIRSANWNLILTLHRCTFWHQIFFQSHWNSASKEMTDICMYFWHQTLEAGASHWDRIHDSMKKWKCLKRQRVVQLGRGSCGAREKRYLPWFLKTACLVQKHWTHFRTIKLTPEICLMRTWNGHRVPRHK